jgi:hypothetical protein
VPQDSVDVLWGVAPDVARDREDEVPDRPLACRPGLAPDGWTPANLDDVEDLDELLDEACARTGNVRRERMQRSKRRSEYYGRSAGGGSGRESPAAFSE